MIYSKLRALIVLVALALPASVFAQSTMEYSDASDITMKKDTGYLVSYLGYYGALRNGQRDLQIGFEYRLSPVIESVRPTVGFNFNADGSAYLYGGVYWDIKLGDEPIYFSPNFVAGYYHAGSRGVLGGELQFRTGFEFSYEFEDKTRVGIALNHISNANLYAKNPGSETVLVSVQFPFAY